MNRRERKLKRFDASRIAGWLHVPMHLITGPVPAKAAHKRQYRRRR